MGAPHRRSVVLTFVAWCLCLPSGAWAQNFAPPAQQTDFLTPTAQDQDESQGPVSVHFGASVSVLGETLLVGMPAYEGGTGRVAIFRRQPSREWLRVGSIDLIGAQPGARFGTGVALGRRIAVVSGEPDSGTGVATAYVFQRSKDRFDPVQTLSLVGRFIVAGVAGDTLIQSDAREVLIRQADSKGRLRLASPAIAQRHRGRLQICDRRLARHARSAR
jgi:hypothetical protein